MSVYDQLLTTHPESIGWFREAVSTILSEPFPGSLRISVHVTQTALNPPAQGDAAESTKSINVSDESLPQTDDLLSVQLTGKRPDLPALIRAATTEDTRPLAIAGKHLCHARRTNTLSLTIFQPAAQHPCCSMLETRRHRHRSPSLLTDQIQPAGSGCTLRISRESPKVTDDCSSD